MTFVDPTLELVQRVRPVVRAHTRRTPLLRSDWLSEAVGADVHLKCENLQVTGSFKIRGALAALELLDEGSRRAGVLTSSAGNHGAGLAAAARQFGVTCRIVVPKGAPQVKIEKMRGLGAEVILSPHDGYDATQEWTLENVAELGGTFVSPFEDPAVIAGNGGTLALEILEDLPDCDTIVVPCGGGGCINGIGLVSHAHQNSVRTVGVNSDASPGMWLSRRDGQPHLQVDSQPTIAEGLEGGVGKETWRLGQHYIDEMILVPEAEIRRAVAAVATRERLVVEGSGAAGVAAVLGGQAAGECICVVLTGGNIDPARLAELLADNS